MRRHGKDLCRHKHQNVTVGVDNTKIAVERKEIVKKLFSDREDDGLAQTELYNHAKMNQPAQQTL